MLLERDRQLAALDERLGDDPAEWRRAVFPARAPFQSPGWVTYDARLTADGIVELRRVEYITADV